MPPPVDEHLKYLLIRSLESIHPAAPQVFGLDLIQLKNPEQILEAVSSRFNDGVQAYFISCFILRLAADLALRERRGELLVRLLRLQGLAGP